MSRGWRKKLAVKFLVIRLMKSDQVCGDSFSIVPFIKIKALSL